MIITCSQFKRMVLTKSQVEIANGYACKLFLLLLLSKKREAGKKPSAISPFKC